MVKATLAVLCAVSFGLASPVAKGNTLYVNDFGMGGWSSWETRDGGGTLLIGSTDSSADAASYFNTAGTSSMDAKIEKQIIFMDSGKSAKSASQTFTFTGPSGSLNGDGYVRLDGTSGANGKSDLGYADLQGIAAASVLQDSSFAAAYRYYLQPYSSSGHPLQMTIAVHGTDGSDYTLTYIQSGSVNGWNSVSISADSGLFALTKKGAGAVGGPSKTLQGWSGTSPYGPALFGPTASIFRVGFSIGKDQQNVEEYLDWAQITLLNGGDMIDFVGPSTVVLSDTPAAAPLPTSAGMGGVLLAMAGVGIFLRRRSTAGVAAA
ncbi:MAG: hypothetical protein ACTHN5_19915 [Phycisphaerae bacterium]